MTTWKLTTLLFIAALISGCGTSLTDKELLDSSKDHLDKGELRAAAIQLKSVLQQSPDNMEARWLLGKIHMELGNQAYAEKELRRAQELGVADEAVLPLLAQTLASQGKLKDLLDIQTNGLSVAAQTQILAAQAATLIAQNKFDQAEAKISHALSLDLNSASALTEQARLLTTKSELAQARNQLENLLKQDSTYAPAWSLLGEIHRREQQPEKAEAAFAKAIEYRLNNFADRLKRTLVRIELKKYDKAQADIDILNRKLPQYFETHYAQGLVHFFQQRYPQAQASFEAALKGNEGYQQAQFYLGATYDLLGQHEQAEHYISRFVAANPNNIASRRVLAQIRLRAGEFTEVEKLLLPVIRTKEDDIDSLKMLASAYMQQGRGSEGITLFSKIATLQPDSAIAQLDLASALLVNGDESKGLKQLDAALALDPTKQNFADEILIRHYLLRKNFNKAFTAANSYRLRNPELAEPYKLLGLIHLAKQEIQTAKTDFEKARKLAPGDILANHSLASLAMQNNDYAVTRQHYEEVLTHHSDHLDTLMKLSIIDEREGREEDMINHLKQAIAAHPEAVQPRTSLARHHLSKGAPEQVTAALGDLQQTQIKNPLVLTVLGQSQLAQRAATDAKITFDRLIDLQPESAQAHYLLALAHAQLGNTQKLELELKKTIALESNHLPARLALARVSLLQQNTEEAKQQLATLKKNAPDNPDVMTLEATLARVSGKQDKALDIYTEVFENVSSSTSMLALAQQKWGMDDKEGTLTLLEQWLEQHPQDVSARLRLAHALSSLKRTTDAVEQYEMVLAESENNLAALNNLAWLLTKSSPKQALKYAEKANSLAPGSAEITDTLAMILMENGEFERALRINERAINKFSDKPSLPYHRAQILEAAGRSSEAQSQLSSLLRNTQAFPERKKAEQMLRRLNDASKP